jgi:hypothetical protein
MKIADIARQVKHNCDISDAKFWGYFSLCGLLLRLRELYKSEHKITPWSSINQKDIGDWITAKEALWAEIEGEDYSELVIDGKTFNPFDVSGINSYLITDNLVYGAGFGLYKKPVFFLGELGTCLSSGSYTTFYIRTEYARDLFAVSGMLQGKEIYIRLEQLRTILWEMFLDFKCRKGGFIANIFSGCGISPEDDINGEFAIKLDSLALRYSEIILNHELAEAFESVSEWSDIILGISDRKAEYFLRGLHDMIADTSEFGPLKRLIDTEDIGSLAFYISLADIFHRDLYPELRKVFSSFEFNTDWALLESVRQKVYAECILLKNKILAANRKTRNEAEFLIMIREFISNS